jgi:hypothetical protein
MLTEPTGPHYTETWKLQIQILILNIIKIFGSVKHVITITTQIRYMGDITLPHKRNIILRIEKVKGSNRNNKQSHDSSLQ